MALSGYPIDVNLSAIYIYEYAENDQLFTNAEYILVFHIKPTIQLHPSPTFPIPLLTCSDVLHISKKQNKDQYAYSTYSF